MAVALLPLVVKGQKELKENSKHRRKILTTEPLQGLWSKAIDGVGCTFSFMLTNISNHLSHVLNA